MIQFINSVKARYDEFQKARVTKKFMPSGRGVLIMAPSMTLELVRTGFVLACCAGGYLLCPTRKMRNIAIVIAAVFLASTAAWLLLH